MSNKKQEEITDNDLKTKTDRFNEMMHESKSFFSSLFSMKGTIDRAGTIISIKKNMKVYGANAWMLIFSIFIASLGLDLNSPAVIIGAMLVSPLMSPILGIGLAIGINDKDTLITSLQHFGIAIVIALTVSTLYFMLTPLGEITPSIISRTKPTFLDGLVAIAGGFAGIISSVQKDKSNAIPGVAIATALMPPLCVSGFGLATWNPDIFFSSFYLFFLNSFFIAISTFVVVQYLNFPQKTYQDAKDRVKTKRIVAVISLLIIIPSTVILLSVLKEVRLKNDIKNFISTHLNTSQRSIVKHSYLPQKDTTDFLVVNILGEPIEELERARLDSILNNSYKSFGVDNPIELTPIQAQVDQEDFLSVQNKISNLEGDFNKKLTDAIHSQSEKDQNIVQLNHTIDSLKNNTVVSYPNVAKEIEIAFPNIKDIALGDISFPQDTFKHFYRVAYINWAKPLNRANKRNEKKRLSEFLKLNMKKDTVIVLD